MLMDRGQAAPIVKFGTIKDIVAATIRTLPFWNEIIM